MYIYIYIYIYIHIYIYIINILSINVILDTIFNYRERLVIIENPKNKQITSVLS